jgi:hypothetical protein
MLFPYMHAMHFDQFHPVTLSYPLSLLFKGFHYSIFMHTYEYGVVQAYSPPLHSLLSPSHWFMPSKQSLFFTHVIHLF